MPPTTSSRPGPLHHPAPHVGRSAGLAAAGATSLMAAGAVGAGYGLVTGALVGITVLSVVAVLRPAPVALVLAFAATAVPKAGVRLDAVPLPVMLPGLCVAVGLLVVCTWSHRADLPRATWVALSAVVCWVSSRCLLMSGGGAPVGDVAALAAWGLVPLTLLAVAQARSGSPAPVVRRWGTALEWGFIAAAVFALVQVVAGIEETIVPGVTLALGDDYASKNNGITVAGAQTFSKIPSSYQNGNVFGLVAAFFLVVAVKRVTAGTTQRRDPALLVLAALAVLFSGSRTAVLAAGIAGCLVLLAGRRTGVKVLVVGLAPAAYALVTLVQPSFADRYGVQAAIDSNAAGRTTMWTATLRELTVRDLVLGQSSWDLGTRTPGIAEGWLGVVQQVGLVGVVLMGLFLVAVLSGPLRDWRAPLLVLLIGVLADSSYFVFPTLFLPAARALAPLASAARATGMVQPGTHPSTVPTPDRLT